MPPAIAILAPRSGTDATNSGQACGAVLWSRTARALYEIANARPGPVLRTKRWTAAYGVNARLDASLAKTVRPLPNLTATTLT
jgi:hypothetical protein